MVTDSYNYKETFEYGRKLGEEVKGGEVFLLYGDLGVGKTVFTQGFAKGLGIDEPVVSPTFTVLKEYYEGRLPLYHFDCYRVEDSSEMEEIGFDDKLGGEGVCLIEWPGQIDDILPSDAVKIIIEKDLEKGFDYRRITMSYPEL